MVEGVDCYIGKKVKINLKNGYYFRGTVLSVGADHLIISDIKDKRVYISLSNIANMVEVDE